MEVFENDIFYDINNLALDKIIELLNEAKKISYDWWVDVLDVNISFARQKIEMSFKDVLKRIDDNTHFVFIHRKGHPAWEHRLEIGFRTMEAKDHFLFIYVDKEKERYFIDKYGLKRL